MDQQNSPLGYVVKLGVPWTTQERLFRSANAVFGNVGRTAPEKIARELTINYW